jgi:D-alanyl-D-alanine carboxypeptidase/D-alanyl-D-alanine-endopeptidase (penicillin-binding protein 4)
VKPAQARAIRVGVVATLCALLPRATSAAGEKQGDSVQELKTAFSQIIGNTALKTARSAVIVSALEDNKILYAHNPDELLNPASNVKLFTAAAALARMGPEYRFETEFHLDGSGPRTSLHVKGKGDPSIVSERLWAIAGDLRLQGIRALKDIVVDESYFDAEREGPGYDQERGDRAYLAPTGAVSFNYNSAAIHIAPGNRVGEKGQVQIEPASQFFVVENRTTTVGRNGRRRVVVSSIEMNGRQKILVTGRLPMGGRSQLVYKKIDSPPGYFAYTLKKFLELRGVKVTGRVRRGPVPKDARLLLVSESESLADVVRKLNKHSNNFIAEQLLKALGATVKGQPGTWPKGIETVEEFLAEVGIPRGSYVMKNGSGLNDTNRFSVRQHIVLLKEMWKRFPLMAEFLGALPIAGKDGTIKWRMEGSDAVGRLRAKTGTLENVTSLSGYVQTMGGERLAFSVIVNDYPGRYAAVVRAVDALGGALAALGGSAADINEAVAAASPPTTAPADSTATAMADLKGRVATYYRLGLAADKRNLPFLRTALRTERNPVLRMAAAEAIYLSEPDGDTAARTFLESVTFDPGNFERLRGLAAELNLPQPVLGSVADLAAEGNPEALARLIEMAPVVVQQKDMVDSFSDTMAEVARTAPEELLVALKSAGPFTGDAALGSLARGLIRAKDKDHPFPGIVRAAAVHPDAAVATFAKGFAPKLDDRLQAVEAALKVPPQQNPVTPIPNAKVGDTRPGG